MMEHHIQHLFPAILLISGLQQGHGFLKFIPTRVGTGVEFSYNGEFRISASLGLSLPGAIGNGSLVDCTLPSDPATECRIFGDFANLSVTQTEESSNGNCARVVWSSNYARRLEDCFHVLESHNMYGGAEGYSQRWPINGDPKEEAPYVTADSLAGDQYGSVLENYWLFSQGVALHADEDNPLFLSWNSTREGQLCLVSADRYPYPTRSSSPLTLKYTVCVGPNVKSVHLSTFPKFYGRPSSLPDEGMLIRPLWSTWAQYKTEVNQSIVLEYARELVARGFALSSHIEIDDHWETCYGDEQFNLDKFPNPSAMVDEITAMNLRVTLWVHPFINFGCPLFVEALNGGHLVADEKGRPALSSWWQGSVAGVINTNEPGTVAWWASRLQRLRTTHGIHSFKFDAGETIWLPHSRRLGEEASTVLGPNIYTTKYVEFVSSFGGLVEARVGHGNQGQGIFFRMLDKNSRWGYDTGLKSMIPTALLFGVLGYPFVLPDMIGGNAYEEWPSKELYIRWMQVNVFMPAVQFSIVPWDPRFDQETIDICLKVLRIREQYRDEILAAANQSIIDGSPMNRALWWVDPTDPITFTVDQEYLLGDSILVAPVVDENSRSRDIYLPTGSWKSATTNVTHSGPVWLRAYPAPLDTVPFFIKVE